MSEDPNLKLIEQAKAGNRQAFKQLWIQHEGKANVVVCSQLQYNRDAASEVMQQVRINALRAIGQFNGNASFSNWLCQVAYQTATDYSEKHIQHHEDSLAEAADSAARPLNCKSIPEMLVTADRIMKTMEVQQQEILQLVCREKRSPAQVADSLGIKVRDVFGAVKVFRRKLHRNMKEPK